MILVTAFPHYLLLTITWLRYQPTTRKIHITKDAKLVRKKGKGEAIKTQNN
jgi:hypothetical protein